MKTIVPTREAQVLGLKLSVVGMRRKGTTIGAFGYGISGACTGVLVGCLWLSAGDGAEPKPVLEFRSVVGYSDTRENIVRLVYRFIYIYR